MIGIVVDTIINNPQNYILFRELNKIAQDHDCYLFANEVQSLPMKHGFAILQQVEALQHKGILIATSMLNAQIVANSLTAEKKYYYIWHPEWTTFSQLGARQLKKIFYNPEINLIARSSSHWNLLTKLFQKPQAIVYNWNAEQLTQAVLCPINSSS